MLEILKDVYTTITISIKYDVKGKKKMPGKQEANPNCTFIEAGFNLGILSPLIPPIAKNLNQGQICTDLSILNKSIIDI